MNSVQRSILDQAWQHYLRDQWLQAEQLYLEVLEIDPHQIDALHLLGMIAVRTGRNDQAAEYFRSVVKIDPLFAAAHSNLGGVYARQGRLNDAVTCFENAVQLQPDFAPAHNNLGNALREHGRPAEAVVCLEHALRLKPDYSEAQHNLQLARLALSKIPVWQKLELALEHYRKGRRQQAEQLYLQVLEVEPHQFDALNLLGVITAEIGQHDRAIGYLRALLHLQPESASAHNNLAIVLIARKMWPEAVASLQQAVRLKPDFADAYNNLGNALREQRQFPEAVANLQQALQHAPAFAEAHFNLGLAWKAQQKFAEAAASFQQAVLLKRNYHDAQTQLRMLQVHLEDGDVSTSRFATDVDISPDRAEAHWLEGNALIEQGKLANAVCSFQQALRCRPDFAEALNGLGDALQQLGQYEQAEASLEQSLRLKPDFAQAHFNLGVVQRKQLRLAAAANSFQSALKLEPDQAMTILKIGDVRKEQGRLDEAIDAFRTALQLKPDAAFIHSNVIFALNYHPHSDARAIHEECLGWNQRHAEPLRQSIQPHGNFPDPERRIRIGYVSPDFREHPCSSFTIPLLANHDHRLYEIFCYANVERPDSLTQRLQGYADAWRDTLGVPDQQVADMIRDDQIDILVDLAMHTAKNRLLVFARKPAPVQVTWLAYPGTTGLSTIDYRLTDPYLDPPGLFDSFYSEETIRLPETFWCYDALTVALPVNSLPVLESGTVTFGCLNNFCKINDDCLSLWARILHRTPKSRLLLLAPRDSARERVLGKLEQAGIAPTRVEFASIQPRQEYFRLYQRIDLALDPLPCNGGTTTLDAFWMGVPTVTLVGKTVVGRAGWSQLCNLGLLDLAAETTDQYVAIAARLAGDLSRLQELRATLRRRLQQSPLMDGKRFARHMEEAYRMVWRRWCERPM